VGVRPVSLPPSLPPSLSLPALSRAGARAHTHRSTRGGGRGCSCARPAAQRRLGSHRDRPWLHSGSAAVPANLNLTSESGPGSGPSAVKLSAQPGRTDSDGSTSATRPRRRACGRSAAALSGWTGSAAVTYRSHVRSHVLCSAAVTSPAAPQSRPLPRLPRQSLPPTSAPGSTNRSRA
jgi:hypothetical protein